MNIAVRKCGKPFCSCRPDTSWERENKDIWLPDFVEKLYFSPVLFARISKAGKCIGDKFVSRYYDGLNFGVLLYAECRCGTSGDEAAPGLAPASRQILECLDHSTLLPHPLYNPMVADCEDNEFILSLGGETVFRRRCGEPLRQRLEDAIREVSQCVSLRIGDFVAVELRDPALLPDKAAGCRLSATFCDNETLNHLIR